MPSPSMAETETTGPFRPPSISSRLPSPHARLWTGVGLLTLLLLLALLPPLLNLGRYQRRVAQSIGVSLGRPVHLDRVTLNILPRPSLTIENFTIEEDAAFGAEPTVRANVVIADLRISSLWRRRIEISRIRFIEPSVNLVLRPDGHWNLEKVLLQAALIEAAPTAQRRAGPAPRFPYIEATGARLNLKLGYVKTPFSLTEADFALWLPEPGQWRMRLKSKPVRTDTSVTDTGVIEGEATLRRAASPGTVPLLVEVAWRKAPLGDTSRILFGHDLGVRGTMDLAVKVQGSLADSAAQWRLNLPGLHRADFVPEKSMRVAVECLAAVRRDFHMLSDLHCEWPVAESSGAVLTLSGSVPDVLQPASAALELGTAHLPAATLLDWLRVLSPRIPAEVTATGSISASLAHANGQSLASWSGEIVADAPALVDSRQDNSSFALDTLSVDVAPTMPAPGGATPLARTALPPHKPRRHHADGSPDRRDEAPSSSRLVLTPATVPLGGAASAMLEGLVDATGYHLHLSGPIVPSRLDALLASLPPLADGSAGVLPRPHTDAPVHVDLTANRTWTGTQVWVDNLTHSPPPARHAHSRR